MIGYMNGLALTILVGQLPKLFGFSTDANGLIAEAKAFVNGLSAGDAVGAAVAIGLGQPGADPRDRPLAAARARRTRRGGRGDRGHLGVRSVEPRRLARRQPAQGLSAAHLAAPGVGFSAARGRRARHRVGRAHRHDLDRLGLRRAHRSGGQRRRRDDRDRRGQPRGGLFPGLPGQHQRVAHGGRRAGGREDPGHRPGRGRGDRADAGARPRAVQEPPATPRWRRW